MNIQLKLLAWFASLLFVLASLYSVYHYGRHIQLVEDEAIKVKVLQEQLQKNSSYAASLLSAGEIHDKDQTTINSLSTKLGRVSVHIPCTTYSTPSTTTDTSGASGVVSTGVDEQFAVLQDRVTTLIKRCDQLNIDAIRNNNIKE